MPFPRSDRRPQPPPRLRWTAAPHGSRLIAATLALWTLLGGAVEPWPRSAPAARAVAAPSGDDEVADERAGKGERQREVEHFWQRLEGWLGDSHDKSLAGTLAFALSLALLTLANEDVACIFAGAVLVPSGAIGFVPASIACFVGIFLGDIGWYLIGRFPGRAALKVPPVKWMLKEEDLRGYRAWFDRRGTALIVLSRFLPGTRTPVFFSAGVLRINVVRAFVYFGIASAMWAPFLIGISAALGSTLYRYLESYKTGIVAVLGVAIALWLVLKVVSKRARDRLGDGDPPGGAGGPGDPSGGAGGPGDSPRGAGGPGDSPGGAGGPGDSPRGAGGPGDSPRGAGGPGDPEREEERR